jgi:hypothetical protein
VTRTRTVSGRLQCGLAASARFAMIVIVSTFGASCVYMQNDSQLKTATDASQKLTAFAKNTPTPFQVMLDNQQKLAGAFQADVQRQNDLHAQAVALSLPGKTWMDLQSQLQKDFPFDPETKCEEKYKYCKLKNDLDDRIEAALKATSVIHKQLKTANDQKQAIDATITATVGKQNELEANRVLFLESIKAIANATASKDPVASLKQNAPEILKSPVTTISYSNGTFSQQSSTVGDQLGETFKTDLQNGDLSFIRNATIDQFDPQRQPGLSLIILSVAADAAQSESQRLNIRLQSLQALQNAITAGLADIQVVENPYNTYMQLNRVLNVSSRNETVLDTLNALSKRANRTDISNALRVASDYILDETIVLDRLELLEYEVASLQHTYSIQVSEANAQERQELIGLGINGLVTYQQNGITSDEIANLIRAAQTIALAFIADGVF